MSGILAGRDFESTLDGDLSIRKRPMKRIIKPLSMMGANISALNNNENAPINFLGGNLSDLNYELPVASAQLKSALILAGLRSNGKVIIKEKDVSRDHTEKMFKSLNIPMKIKKTGKYDYITVSRPNFIKKIDFNIPGDISSAAFFIVLEQTLGSYTENWQFWLGLILILEILYVRSGILSLFDFF